MSDLLLRVIAGPSAGTDFVLRPGAAMTLGRDPASDVVLNDPSVSRRHAEVRWSGDTPVIYDLDSRAGVRRNEQMISMGRLRPGDKIQLGTTVLSIEVKINPGLISPAKDGEPRKLRLSGEPSSEVPETVRAPVAILTDVPSDMTETNPGLISGPGQAEINPGLISLLGEIKKRTPLRLFAVVDGAQAYDIAFTARRQGAEVYTLFSGELALQLAHVGPCLIAPPEPLPFLDTWMEASGKNAGVLLLTSASLEDLYAHLRSIFIVTDESGQEYFFRYYDPRVLKTFLPTCSQSQLKEFFGPIGAWIAESDAGAFQISSFGAAGLEKHTLSVAAATV